MPSWNELVQETEKVVAQNPHALGDHLVANQASALSDISNLRSGRNVILYGSSFLQKPTAPPQYQSISHEDINAFMSVLHGMDWKQGLTLILHTPGGVTNATETIVEYLLDKFGSFEVMIPTYAMSAGTMISLASESIVMGRQSQLGPIDPQLPFDGRSVSARAIVNQFERAKEEISQDQKLAHVWAPILAKLGPALIQEAQNNLDYSERMVAGWLSRGMFRSNSKSADIGQKIAEYFNDSELDHKSHGRRISRDEAKQQGLIVENLEDNQQLQESLLTAYHLMTIIFDKTPAAKMLATNHGKIWIKNLQQK